MCTTPNRQGAFCTFRNIGLLLERLGISGQGARFLEAETLVLSIFPVPPSDLAQQNFAPHCLSFSLLSRTKQAPPRLALLLWHHAPRYLLRATKQSTGQNRARDDGPDRLWLRLLRINVGPHADLKARCSSFITTTMPCSS